ncbi:hypothetical protein EGT56_15295 [Arachnia propionica]|nr:hypothetical protein EGT56_15295 [Arachnia propionica]
MVTEYQVLAPEQQAGIGQGLLPGGVGVGRVVEADQLHLAAAPGPFRRVVGQRPGCKPRDRLAEHHPGTNRRSSQRLGFQRQDRVERGPRRGWRCGDSQPAEQLRGGTGGAGQDHAVCL